MCHRWRCLSLLPRTLALVAKAVQQALLLLGMMLFWLPSPDLLLLQVHPPCHAPRKPQALWIRGMPLHVLSHLSTGPYHCVSKGLPGRCGTNSVPSQGMPREVVGLDSRTHGFKIRRST